MSKRILSDRIITLIPVIMAGLMIATFNTEACPKEKSSQDYEETPGKVITGADRLFSEYSYLIDGKKVALVTNHTGRLTDGTHLVDALYKYPGVKLTVLFGMEFNIRSNDYSLPRDGECAIDPETGITKYSLYGSIHKPSPEMLKNVDVIVFDIQEVGARFYEHVNILGFIMEAAAENNIEVVVLDRPNPITGIESDGFITDNEFLYGFGAYGKIPVIHAMTMGEIARLYNGESMLRGGAHARLHVIEMTGWERSMWFDQTGLEWIKPSPNLPTQESMLAYTGTCLFEGLNISAGRGSEKPFQYIGAPWIDNDKVVKLLNDLGLDGVVFDTVTFIPRKMPYHSQNPLFTGLTCKGIFVRVTDRNRFEPYKTGISMIWAIHKLHSETMQWNDETMNRLVGTRRLQRMIKEGYHPNEIFASWKNELADFVQIRNKYLIY